MSPSTWAQSSQTRHPISLKVSCSSLSGGGKRKTDRPNCATLGFTSFSSLMVPSTSRFMSSTLKGYCTELTDLCPNAPNFWVEMWAPCARAQVVMVSPGWANAKRTAMLATVPEMGLTSAKSALNRSFASSMALISTLST